MTEAAADILLVEDEADDAELLTRALLAERPGTRVRVVSDGMEALRQLLGEGNDPKPQLIILDLNLPGLNGMELLRCLTGNARTADIPVYMLSGSCSPEDVGASRSYGAKACMRKPSSASDIRRVVQLVTRSLH